MNYIFNNNLYMRPESNEMDDGHIELAALYLTTTETYLYCEDGKISFLLVDWNIWTCLFDLK